MQLLLMMKLRFCSKGCLRRSLVPWVGPETVEFRDCVFLSVFEVLVVSGKGVRSMSLSWKQPSNAIAWLASQESGICRDKSRRGELVCPDGIYLVLFIYLTRYSRPQTAEYDLCLPEPLHLLHGSEVVDSSVLDDRQEDKQEAGPQVDVYGLDVRHLWHRG